MQTPARVGASHFGGFDPSDRDAIHELFVLPVSPFLAPPFDVLHDASQIEVFDRLPFDLLREFLALRMPALVANARRFALVRPPGLAGAVYTGLFHDWTDAADAKTRLFDDRAAALAWLEVPSADRDALGAMWNTFEKSPPLLRELRQRIERDLDGATLERIASAMGQSARSLQRRLAGEKTSFRGEVERVRIALARIRLLETDDKIDAIANELGFSSTASFATMFRRSTGETPGELRARRK
jgi:AraC-like DNA-binding protein